MRTVRRVEKRRDLGLWVSLYEVREEFLMANRTATETVMKAMESFGEVEPKDCIIIWTDENGYVCWSSTTDSTVTRFGMIEFVRQTLIKQMEAPQ